MQGAGSGLANYKVSLYASFVDRGPSWKLLGSGSSDSAGDFQSFQFARIAPLRRSDAMELKLPLSPEARPSRIVLAN